MHRLSLPLALLLLTAAIAAAENPFLSAPDDKPVTSKFRGAEWGDEIAQEEIPLSARITTTRVAKTNWGEIFKVTFSDIASRASKRRQIPTDYFVATEDHIYLLNEENNEAAVKRLSVSDQAPEFEKSDIYGINEGRMDYTDGLWETIIQVKDDLCTMESNHSSGTFEKIVWKKGVGLVEYSMGNGARDGFRLKRVLAK